MLGFKQPDDQSGQKQQPGQNPDKKSDKNQKPGQNPDKNQKPRQNPDKRSDKNQKPDDQPGQNIDKPEISALPINAIGLPIMAPAIIPLKKYERKDTKFDKFFANLISSPIN